MKTLRRLALPVSIVVTLAAVAAVMLFQSNGSAVAQSPSEAVVIDHTVLAADGSEVSLSDYRGSAVLIVNTASACGYTSQLATLELLRQRYQGRGFEVLAFPCNDFGGQEPGTTEEIEAFYCDGTYNVTFPIFDKVHAVGDEQSPLYTALTTQSDPALQGDVRWNFTKFLVNPEGHVVARFEPGVDPMDDEVREAVEAILPR
ncbi:MAG: glutathione peroxidase [Bradymonadia bacterium]|jgi:glutathione peroxidase